MFGDISELLQTIAKMSRQSPGITLIVFGFLAISLLAVILRFNNMPSLAIYIVLAFGMSVAFAGVLFLFLQLRQSTLPLGISEAAVNAGDLEHAVTQLGKNYDILRRQTTQGFILAGIFMACGLIVILAGSAGQLFGLTTQGINLTMIAGVVSEAVAGLGLYLFKQTFERLNMTSDRLHETWKILAAFKKAEILPEDRRADVVVSLITALAMPTAGIK